MPGTYSFVLAIIAMSLAAGIINNYLRTKRLNLKKGELDEFDARVGRVEHQLRDLTDRVQAVEAIVTDRNFDLKSTIESL